MAAARSAILGLALLLAGKAIAQNPTTVTLPSGVVEHSNIDFASSPITHDALTRVKLGQDPAPIMSDPNDPLPLIGPTVDAKDAFGLETQWQESGDPKPIFVPEPSSAFLLLISPLLLRRRSR